MGGVPVIYKVGATALRSVVTAIRGQVSINYRFSEAALNTVATSNHMNSVGVYCKHS